jgi:hypothetical protein
MLDFTKKVPVAARGFGLLRNKYMSGRVAASVCQHGGIGEIRYFGRQPIGSALFFKADEGGAFDKLFRLQLEIDGRPYYLEFNDTEHYPFGFRSYFVAEDVRVRHELVVLDDALVQRIVLLDNPAKRAVSARLLFNAYTRVNAARREWSDFDVEPDGGGLRACVQDQAPPLPTEAHWSLTQGPGKTPQLDGRTFLTVASDKRVTIRGANRGFKYYMNASEPADTFAFFVLFGHDRHKHANRLQAFRLAVHSECDCRFEDFERQLDRQPRFETGDRIIDSALANAVPTVLNLCVSDTPGAMRASQDYWVWGWDSLVHADALLLSGNPKVVKDMLYFYRDTACPERGVIHALNTSFGPYHYMAFGAQCLFITVLYNYWAATGDRDTLSDLYPFSQWILNRTRETADARTGLATGASFYPDFPEYLGQNGNDISLVNNSLFYQAIRAMTIASGELGDCAAAAELASLGQELRSRVETLLFNQSKGYWRDSISSEDSTPREHFPLYAAFGVSPFAYELGSENIDRIADFMWRNYPFERGLYMFPQWDDSFMEDGNQLGSYYPGIDRYFWNIMNRSGNAQTLEQYRGIVSCYWNKHTYPEGQCHETVNPDAEIDNPGCKQAFSAKSWYCDYLELTTGISIDSQGISFRPLQTLKPLVIEGLRLRGKRLSVRIGGQGRYPVLRLNGRALPGCCRISWQQLEAENELDIAMEASSDIPIVVGATEMSIRQTVVCDRCLEMDVEAPIQSLMVLLAPSKPQVQRDGNAVEIVYFNCQNVAHLTISAGRHKVVLALEEEATATISDNCRGRRWQAPTAPLATE